MTALEHATSRAKLVRLCEGVKLVVQDWHSGGCEGSARLMLRRHPAAGDEKIHQEWCDFLVSLTSFRIQRIERLRVSAEITLA